jgi:DNA gyrase subunit A
LEEFRKQKRGGVGVRGTQVREEDAVIKLLVCDTHDNLLFFTDRGKVYHLRGYDVPDTKKQAKGLPIINLIEIEGGERVTAILPIKSYERDFLLLGTRNGVIKKTKLSDFAEVRRNGKIAMRLDDGDQLIAVRPATDSTNVLMISSEGQAIRFKIDDLRDASRTSGGVRGMRLPSGGYVVGIESLDDGEELLIISERGFGKRTRVDEYPVQGRGGQGVKTLNITDRTGNVAACRIIDPRQELILVSEAGIVIRTTVNSISLLGRNTQGVTVMKVSENDRVASIAAIAPEERKARQDRDLESVTPDAPSTNGASRGRSMKAQALSEDDEDQSEDADDSEDRHEDRDAEE